MKKAIICLLLVFSVLVGVTACVSTPEPETGTELSSDAAESAALSAVKEEERSLFFRYYYISIWLRICASAQNGDDSFDPNAAPDTQYYKESKKSKSILWSDELAILAANESNKTITLYNDALKSNGFKLDSNAEKMISDTLDMAEKSASDKKVSFADYLTGYYGSGFTPEFFTKMLTIEQANYAYSTVRQNAFMAERSKTVNSYEEYSELAAEDFEKYYQELLPLNTEKFYVDDVFCTDGKAAALACIRERISDGDFSN